MADVAVVGAGLAGLAAARTLAEAGAHVTVPEASAAVGGLWARPERTTRARLAGFSERMLRRVFCPFLGGVLLDPELTTSRRQFGRQVDDWDHLATYRIRHAQPAQPPPALAEPQRPVCLAPGVYVCGDHRDNASINGALASGRRCGEAVLGELS